MRKKFDIDDAIRRYQAGEPITEIAAVVGVSAETIRRRLRDRGALRTISESQKLRAQTAEGLAQMRAAQALGIEARRRTDLAAASVDIIAAYLGGESAKSIGDRYGCSGTQIAEVVAAAGIPVRDKSAAGKVRAAQIPDDVKAEFYRLVAAKNRSRTKPADSVVQTASTKHRRFAQKVGAGEQEVAEHLAAAGFDVDRQVAAGRYNLDVTASGVAVEIHTAPHGPHLARGRIHRRVNYLTDNGWHVLYAWATRGINGADLEQIVALVEQLRLNPPTPGQYTVLRCQGNSRPRRGANQIKGAFVVTARQMGDTGS